MRVLFLVLVLANLGFAAWATWYSGPQPPARPVTSNAPALAIYGEPADAVSAVGDAAGAPAQQRMTDCISVGPLPNRVDVEDAVSALGRGGFRTRQRVAQGEVWLGQWVYIDAIATQAEAAEIVAELADNGIAEAYVIADGNNGSIVSLGVFSQQARARQRFADAQALGFAPAVADRFQPGEVFWLDVTARDGEAFALAVLPELGIDTELRFENCENSGADAAR